MQLLSSLGQCVYICREGGRRYRRWSRVSLSIPMPMLPLSLKLSFVFLATLFSFLAVSHQQPVLSSSEQESVYQVLESVNSGVPWRTLFPDDLCSSAPHGVFCDYFSDSPNNTEPDSVHVTELSFGFVSDFSPNPTCSLNSSLNPLLFTSFKYLRKLFFYKCFTGARVSVPTDISPSFGPSLEELISIDNPSLVGPLSSILGNFTNIRRLVLTGNGVYGQIPDLLTSLINLEEITLSRNQLGGEVPANFAHLKKLKILDLSHNFLEGSAPEFIGNISGLIKLDLSSNGFAGKIPESFGNLKKLEFLDLSFNRFGNFGIPLFLTEMTRLSAVHLSGNSLGGQIPQDWENLGNISGIGFSGLGLVGHIPASMARYLRNLSYLWLDNNNLEGNLPEEFAFLESLNEINLENNNLTGRFPFSAELSAKLGLKLKLEGNPDLCIDGGWRPLDNGGSLRFCNKVDIPNPVFLSKGWSMKIFGFTPVNFLIVFLWILSLG